jgi:hypothetical protein
VNVDAAEAGHGGGGHGGGGGGHFSGGGGFHAGGSVHVGGGGVGFHGSVGFRGGFRGYAGGGWHGGYSGRGYAHGYSSYRGYGWYGGHVGWGGGWYGWGWPYYYGYYPEYVPSYYGTTYYPIQGAPAASAAVVVAPRPQLPRFGVGVGYGVVSTSDPGGTSMGGSSDLSFLGRFRLTPGLIIEGELGKTDYDSSERVDRRLGASLIYEIGAYNKLAPYLLVGGGVQQANVNGDYNTTQDFAEVGVGLRYAITPHFHIAADLRAGERGSVSNDSNMSVLSTASRTLAPPTSSSGQTEDYTRGRLSAILYF